MHTHADKIHSAGGRGNRRFLARRLVATALLALFAVLSASNATAQGDPGYEIWALDQGTNIIHIIRPDSATENGFEVAETIDLGSYPDAEIDMPHMIDFTRDYAYAVIASPASANTTVIRAADREIVAVLPTGAGTHMASFTPDDSRIIVDVIQEGTIVEIAADLQNESFEISRTLIVANDSVVRSKQDAFSRNSDGELMTQPICHDYTHDGRYAYITLGPGLSDGGLVVLDLESFSLVEAFGPNEISVNCGTVSHPEDDRFYINGGSVEQGHWYVFDTTRHRPIPNSTGEIRRSSHGYDAHGVSVTPDSTELWMVNRASSDGIVIDPATNEVKDYIDWTGKSPDILTFSPDGEYAFITLRGPQQRSGPHAIAGDTPGVSVMRAADRSIHAILELDPERAESDFHGIGMRRR